MKLDKNKTGLVLGIFFAFIHLIWSVLIAVIPSIMQNFVNWMLKLHHISLTFTIIQPFNIINAALLVVMTFIHGFVFGWLFAFAWSWIVKK